MMAEEPILRTLSNDDLRSINSSTLSAALLDVLSFFSSGNGNPEKLLSIGLRLNNAGRHEAASEALVWAEANPTRDRINALGFLLQGLWDGFEATTQVRADDVARAIDLRAAVRPDAAADHQLLMALAATLSAPAARPIAIPFFDSLSLSRADGTPRDPLLAAAVRTYRARGAAR